LERGAIPHPRVFFVRVANKGLMLDVASRASTFGELNTETQSAQRSEMGTDLEVRAPSKLTSTALMVGCLKLKGEGEERVHPPGFCERVRKSLMGKGLGKHSFLKSVEEHENRGVNFVRFAEKSEKSEGAEIGRAPSKLTSTALSASRVKGREWRWRGRNPSRLRVNMKNDSTKVTDCQ
jgi:hypothetical protein